MGVSEVLLCPYRCLEYKMERLEKLKIQLCFYSRFLIVYGRIGPSTTASYGTGPHRTHAVISHTPTT